VRTILSVLSHLFPPHASRSNDELLEILSQTKDPRAVQPHLGKCFEGISRVRFRGDDPTSASSGGSGSDLTITAMLSAEGEAVPLLKHVDPEAGGNKGCVELWLTELQGSMRSTLRSVIAAAAAAYTSTPRADWVLQWPGQVVLCVSQMFWTREVEEALAVGGSAALAAYGDRLTKQLGEIITLVRGGLTPLQRETLGALTVIDVHARDVVAEMVAKRVQRASEFEWNAQLRYYWQQQQPGAGVPTGKSARGGSAGPTAHTSASAAVDAGVGDAADAFTLVAKIVGASQAYGYEYLGNTSRLVITPLTDR
jgi:dynein heavy chain